MLYLRFLLHSFHFNIYKSLARDLYSTVDIVFWVTSKLLPLYHNVRKNYTRFPNRSKRFWRFFFPPSCFQPKQIKTVPTVSTCYACKAGCWNGFKRVLACCILLRITALLILLLGFCTQLFLAILWTTKTRGKLSLEQIYGWCQKPFFSVFF